MISVYWGKSNDVVDGASSYSSPSRETMSCDSCVSAFGREGMGRGAAGGGGITADARPGGNRGGRLSSLRLSDPSSELRVGSEAGEGGWGRDLRAGSLVRISESGAGRTRGTGLKVKGGGGGTVKGGSDEVFVYSTSSLSPGTVSSSTSLLSSGFQPLSRGDKIDCRQ